ncbi:MAG: hypothetical protein F6J93_16435 [Oscillatoria sp. SIO1A7]|nr:hypothetical protein [Oscillatoria sp. SIO1A7]
MKCLALDGFGSSDKSLYREKSALARSQFGMGAIPAGKLYQIRLNSHSRGGAPVPAPNQSGQPRGDCPYSTVFMKQRKRI